jgi:HD-like signal output (HDOD) protein
MPWVDGDSKRRCHVGRESLAKLSPVDSVAAREYIAAALASPQTIAPMPKVCADLAELTSRESTDAAQFARLVQSDPVLAGEIMRVANSPALRPRSPIVSLQQAVSWLGISEVKNIATAVMLRGEVFIAHGHEPESEELWRESWLAALWAKELARIRRKHVESAFLAALMHRTGAALAFKLLSRLELEQRTVIDARTFSDLVAEFEPTLGRVLMEGWRIPADVQQAASDWRSYRDSPQVDLAAMVHASHLLAAHTLHPQLLVEEIVLESAVFEELGVFPDDRRHLLTKLDLVRSQAAM